MSPLLLEVGKLVDKTMDAQYPTVTERYFTPKYVMGADIKNRAKEDHKILFHSNKIAVLTLAELHPILYKQKTVHSVNFNMGKHMNREESTVKGKRKRGGHWLEPYSPVCCISCTDDSLYTVYSCIRGHLVEINTRLLERPCLITEKPDSDGYIAIIMTKLNESQSEQEKLLTKQQYLLAANERHIEDDIQLPMKLTETKKLSDVRTTPAMEKYLQIVDGIESSLAGPYFMTRNDNDVIISSTFITEKQSSDKQVDSSVANST